MPGSAKATIDHEEIRRWVEARGGCPAHVKRTGRGDDPGMLRIDFPGYSGKQTLERISWEQFFEWFEKNELAFLHQDEQGKALSRFNKLVRRDSVELPPPAKQPPQEMDALVLIQAQHDEVRELFSRGDLGEEVTDELLQRIATHLALEEGVLYPALLDTVLAERTYENLTEHMGVKRLIADLIEGSPDPTVREAQLRVLRRLVEEHMEEEEQQVLPVVGRLFDESERQDLARDMESLATELTEDNPDGPLETVLSSAEVPAQL